MEALEDENAELTRQLAEEKLTQQQLDELQELAALLNYDYTKQEFNIVTGDVISLDGSNWTNIFTINCGTESGIKVGDAVVNGLRSDRQDRGDRRRLVKGDVPDR